VEIWKKYIEKSDSKLVKLWKIRLKIRFKVIGKFGKLD
jgi:hypothetical protein